jgi:hypothetical protein
MVSWDFLDWLEMGGNELVVKYDSGLESGVLPGCSAHPEPAI